MTAWLNPRIYGIWINEKRIFNALLQNYSSTDFSQVFVSKLAKNTVNNGRHYYQVNMMTNDYYNQYYRKTVARARLHLPIADKDTTVKMPK